MPTLHGQCLFANDDRGVGGLFADEGEVVGDVEVPDPVPLENEGEAVEESSDRGGPQCVARGSRGLVRESAPDVGLP